MYKANLHSHLYLRLIISSAGISRFGTSTLNLAVIWFVLLLTHNTVLAGLSDSMMTIPLVFSFVVGSIVDRSRRKRTMAIAASMARALAMLPLVLFASRSSYIAVIAIYVSTFATGLTSDVLNSVRSSWIKALSAEDMYLKTVSSLAFAETAADGLGYLASGLIIAFGIARSFSLFALIFAAAAVPVALIRIESAPDQRKLSLYIKEGLSFAIRTGTIREAMVMAMLANLFLGILGILIVSLVQIGLHLPAIYVSVIFALFVGGISTGSYAARYIHGSIGVIGALSFVMMASSLIAMSISPSFFALYVSALLAGTGIGVANVAIGTALMKIVPSDMMARIQGSFNTFGLAMVSVSGITGGILISVIGVRHAIFTVGSAIMALSSLYVIFRNLRSVRV